MDRRKVLSLFSTAPLAVKAASDKAIAELSGIEANGLGDSNVPAHTSQDPTKLSDHIKLFGIPEIFIEEARKDSETVYTLDPDIACKKTWSMNVKIITQRQRNYEKALKGYSTRGEFARKIKLWEKLTGIKFSW
jgi:hypothetical protein